MNKLKHYLKDHRAPWFVYQANIEGVIVKDARGEVVFEEWFGECPAELSGAGFSKYVESRFAFADWLVSVSEFLG